MREREARRAIVEVCRRMYERGLIAGSDGNVSIRLPTGRVLVTPSGRPKGMLAPADLVLCGLDGRVAAGGVPSIELRSHLVAYGERPDVAAVVHGHPPFATALTLAGVSLTRCVLPEICLVLGEVPVVPYAPPFSDEMEAALRPAFRRASVIVLDRHGAIALGRTVEEAYGRLETLEHAAHVLHAALTVGDVEPLSREVVGRLREAARRFGLPGPPECGSCRLCVTSRGSGRRGKARRA